MGSRMPAGLTPRAPSRAPERGQGDVTLQKLSERFCNIPVPECYILGHKAPPKRNILHCRLNIFGLGRRQTSPGNSLFYWTAGRDLTKVFHFRGQKSIFQLGRATGVTTGRIETRSARINGPEPGRSAPPGWTFGGRPVEEKEAAQDRSNSSPQALLAKGTLDVDLPQDVSPRPRTLRGASEQSIVRQHQPSAGRDGCTSAAVPARLAARPPCRCRDDVGVAGLVGRERQERRDGGVARRRNPLCHVAPAAVLHAQLGNTWS